jgi:hypothetical protein
MQPTNRPALNRRSFLKLGVAGSSLLAGAGLIGSLHGCGSHSVENDTYTSPQSLSFLRQKDAIILSAIAPVVLKGNFPQHKDDRQKTLNQLLTDIDHFVAHTTAPTQAQVHQLFDLLYFSLTRVTLAGLWPSWEEATEADIEAFLQGWQDSRFNTFRQGYVLLTQLPTLMYYYEPTNWADTIYPGPPQHIPS